MIRDLKLMALAAITTTMLATALRAGEHLATGSSAVAVCGTAKAGNALEEWQAGKRVTLAEAKAFGLDRCFTATEIPDRVFKRMWGKSYKKNCSVPRAELRYVRVLHRNMENEVVLGEMVCHKSVAADLTDIFRKLFDAGYPIERMVLIDNYGADDVRSMDANNTTCFNFRVVAGSQKLSNHSYGKAVDINPLYNPYVARRKDGTLLVSPKSGKPYADRSRTFRYKIDKNDLCYRLFTEHGFEWGGNWNSKKDYQHFEKH